MLMLLGALLLFLLSEKGNTGSNKKKFGSARWAGKKEKLNAQKVAIKQINERRRDGLTTWINQPKIVPLKKEIKDQKGKVVKRFKVVPNSKTIFIPDCQRGTAVIGAPGCGKTFSVLNPQIRSVIEQGFPIVLYDFKYPGQSNAHIGYAKKMGYEVRIFAPGYSESECCNLLDFLRSPDDADTAGQIAKTLNKNFSMNSGKGTEDPFFQQSGDQLIKAVIQLAKLSEAPDFLTCQKILAIDPSALIDRVRAAKLSPWIKVSWEQFMSMRNTEKTSASVIATASLLFANFVSPDILPCICGETTIPLDLEGKQMLVFGMDQTRRDIVGPIVAAVMHMIIVRNIAKQRKDPLAVFLDELPTIYLPSLVNWLNESRSAGFCGFLGFQNLSQLEKAWGKDLAKAVIAGCNTKCIFNPGELESARYFSEFLGEEEVKYKQKSRSRQKGGSSQTISDQERNRRLVTVDEMLKLKPGSFILINPAYSDGREASIPMKIEAKILPKEIEKEEKSIKIAEKMVQAFIKRRERQRLKLDETDILLREIAIERVIPYVDERQPPQGQRTADDLVANVVSREEEFGQQDYRKEWANMNWRQVIEELQDDEEDEELDELDDQESEDLSEEAIEDILSHVAFSSVEEED